MDSIQLVLATDMAILTLCPAGKLNLDEVCEMIADECRLAQIGAQFERSRNVIWKFLHKNEEHRQVYLAAL